MSRNIQTTAHSLTEEDRAIQNTQNGKLIFTEVRGRLCALYIHNDRLKAIRVLSEAASKIGAIYIGKVKNVVKNIDACFVEIADGEICFLPLKETTGAFLTNRNPDGRILEGDELLVQVIRDAQKTKQASVTARISISNDVFALTLGKPGIGYSGKLSKEQKAGIRAVVEQNNWENNIISHEYVVSAAVPYVNANIGMVVRTHAGDCSEAELKEAFTKISTDLVSLLNVASHRSCFSLIKEAPSDLETVLQQLVYSHEYGEILTDSEDLYKLLEDYVRKYLPDKAVRLYHDEAFPLPKLYALESKLDTALEARVWLKSGGYLIIEPTEAMTVIDVNSGKYDAKKTNPDALYRINCEAADEIALQLRLRNLSGIIVVDFINMDSKQMQEQLLERLRKLVQKDKQKTVVVDMTALGLVEITRKKEYKPLKEQMSARSSVF